MDSVYQFSQNGTTTGFVTLINKKLQLVSDSVSIVTEAPPTLAPISELIRENLFSMILPYACIFLASVTGNLLVIMTIVLNKRMRTVTNAFLLNLAISDLLLGVVCMPFTLIGMLMRNFIFGSLMCSLIPYLQAVSVSVSSWTLVTMSYERYFAICHPLKSRESRQTWGHTKRMLTSVWLASTLSMLPIAILSELKPIKDTARVKCRESWPSSSHLLWFTIFLDVFLFVIPLIIMSATYISIAVTLWRNMKSSLSTDIPLKATSKSSQLTKAIYYESNQQTSGNNSNQILCDEPTEDGANNGSCPQTPQTAPFRFRCSQEAHRHEQQNRVIKMLFVVVLEFFVCWTPLHVVNTLALVRPRLVYFSLGYGWIAAFQLLAFMSSCCNPITYCFMNGNFRKSFFDLFKRSPARGHNWDESVGTINTKV